MGTVKDAARDTIPIPFANLSVYALSDTTKMVTGCITNIDGMFKITQLTDSNYLIRISSLGYETQTISVAVVDTKTNINVDVRLKPATISLDEVVVQGENQIQRVDRKSYFFTKEQMAKAKNSRDMVATLPKLFVNKMDNSLSMVNGKGILILINGVISSDRDLRLLSPDRIKRVDVFDVPPIQYYNQAEVVINVVAGKLESGYNVDAYLQVGQLFESFSPSFSYIRGNNRFTMGYDLHINPKRDTGKEEEGIYNYRIDGNDYHYSYNELDRSWNDQHAINLTYAHAVMDNHLFLIKGDMRFANYHTDDTKNIFRSFNDVMEQAEGSISGKTKTLNPSLDIYYAKYFSKKSSLAIDLVGTYYSNEQNAHSYESGSMGYDYLLDLDSRKSSLIGEAVYTQSFGEAQMNIGYKGNFSFLRNLQHNENDDNREHVNTQNHYLYGELSGSINKFMYRLSLGVNNNRKLGEEGFNNTSLMPVALLGYKINDHHTIRFKLDNTVTMPGIQQMSGARALVMRDIYRTGNADLTSSHLLNWALNYDYSNDRVSLSASFFLKNNRNSMFSKYVEGTNSIELKTFNSHKDIKEGCDLTLTLIPFDWWVLELSVVPTYEIFQPDGASETYYNWTFPCSVYTQFSYKKYTFSYYQIFGNEFIEGMYMQGLEKVSYVSLEYAIKHLTVGVQMYFPFVLDKYKSYTLDGSLVENSYHANAKEKNRALALTVSWSFSKNKKKEPQKLLFNDDTDGGTF